MINLALASLIAAVVSQVAGCIITTGDDTDADHSITVSWALETSATGLAASCPPGYDTAALFSQEVDTTGAAIGPPTIDLFDCASGIGESSRLPPGSYDEWVEITNTDNTMQFARSKSNLDDATTLELSTDDLSYATQIIVDGGYFHVAWELVGADSSMSLTCAEVGADGGIEVTAMLDGSPMMATKVLTCTEAGGLTDGLPSGTYTISVDAFTSANQTLGTAPVLSDKTIADPSALQPVTDLGTITIPITGM